MSDLLKKFTADVDLATTKRRIINIGRALAAHFDEETAALRARAETAEAKLAVPIPTPQELEEWRQRALKAERERDAALERVRLGRKPITKDSSGYCPGTCEYRELTRDISALMAARDAAEAQVAVLRSALREMDDLVGEYCIDMVGTGSMPPKKEVARVEAILERSRSRSLPSLSPRGSR